MEQGQKVETVLEIIATIACIALRDGSLISKHSLGYIPREFLF
jgi:hypothetical protein